MIVLGLDISTSCTGYSILQKKETTSLVEAGCIELKKQKTFFDKCLKIEDFFLQIDKRHKIDRVSVEVNLQSFRPGMSSAKTLQSLAKINGVACFLAEKQFQTEPEFVSVTTARSKLGIKINRKSEQNTKEQVLSWVKNNSIFCNYGWPQKTMTRGPRAGITIDDPSCYDIADASVIALYSCI